MPFGKWADGQKRQWCKEKLNLNNDRVITCMSRNKHTYIPKNSLPGQSILIDDRTTYINQFEAAGGKGYKYYESGGIFKFGGDRSSVGPVTLLA